MREDCIMDRWSPHSLQWKSKKTPIPDVSPTGPEGPLSGRSIISIVALSRRPCWESQRSRDCNWEPEDGPFLGPGLDSTSPHVRMEPLPEGSGDRGCGGSGKDSTSPQVGGDP